VADALVEWLCRTEVEWDEFDAHNMPVPFGFAEFLVERADRAGFSFRLDQEETAAVLPLPGESDLVTFFDMHRGAEGDKGHFMDPSVATFFERVARSFMQIGWLRLNFLEVGDRALASTFGFELDGALYLYNSAYDIDARRLSPGLLLVAHQIEDAIESGLHTFDFMRGPERYKYQLGAQAVPLNNLRILREGL